MTSEDILTEDIDKAIGRYIGCFPCPTDEWPEIASVLSELIQRTGIYSPSGFDAAQNAKELMSAISRLTSLLTRVMT